MAISNGDTVTTRKPRVVSIGYPKWAGKEYMEAFEAEFDLHVGYASISRSTRLQLTESQWIEPSDRAGTVASLKAKVESHGPFEAIAILMGTGPYEPFDEEMLRPLVPECKLVVSASAGYDDYDVDWMTRNNIGTPPKFESIVNVV